jgi:hypothetical protein
MSISFFLSYCFNVFENVQAMDEYGNDIEEAKKLRLDGF